MIRALAVVLLAPLACAATTVQLSTPTLQMVKACTTPSVVRKGPDLIVRCDGRDWLTIRDAASNCPNASVTRDSAGNYTLHC